MGSLKWWRVFLLFFLLQIGVYPLLGQEKPAIQPNMEEATEPLAADEIQGLKRKVFLPHLEGSEDRSPTTPFGHSIFTFDSRSFEPYAQGSLDPDYPIGPDDEIIITVWGQVEFTYKLTVDRSGGINIPRAGKIFVNGIALKNLEKIISRRMGKVYSGITQDPKKVTTFVEVSLGKMKSIKIFVTGEVHKPGSFIMTANSSIMTALYLSGGPTNKGSMRDIRLFRHDKQVASIDLYKFILDGEQSADLRIQNGDVVLVPPQGKEVILEGKVHRPHTYELKAGEGLKRLIEISGGLEAEAYTKRVQIERVLRHRDYTVIDVDLEKLLDSSVDSPLFDGDSIFVASVPKVNFKNIVLLSGYTKFPGRYSIFPGMKVKDLISKSEGLLPEAYLGRADIKRIKPDMTRELLSFNLGKALSDDSENNLELSPLDEVKVYSIHTFGEKKFVTIEGLVRDPGKYELLEGMGLQDLIVQAGGLRDIAYKVDAEISRSDLRSKAPESTIRVFRAPISDSYEIKTNSVEKLLLQHRDVVFIRHNPDFEDIRNVTIEGEVRFPGVYALGAKSRHLIEVLQRGGGLTEEADPNGVRLFRPSLDTLDTIAIDFIAARDHPASSLDPLLRAGDVIRVPKKLTTIGISGAVYTPKHVLFRPGKGVSYYLSRAGGVTSEARKGDIYVVLANGESLKPGGFLFWKSWPSLSPGSRIVVPFKSTTVVLSQRPTMAPSERLRAERLKDIAEGTVEKKEEEKEQKRDNR